MPDADQPWDAVARHEVALATLLAFTERSLAARASVLLDPGDGAPVALLECEPGGPLSLTEDGHAHVVPVDAIAGVTPWPMADPRAVPASALEIDPEEGTVAAPLGAMAALGEAVLALAQAMGGRSVATAEFATRSGEPITIAARQGEPLVLAVGEDQFELPL